MKKWIAFSLICGVLALAMAPSHAAWFKKKTPRRTINIDMAVGYKSLSQLEYAIDLAKSGDTEAFQKWLLSMAKTGNVIIFTKGETVYLVYGRTFGYVPVRRKGETAIWWTISIYLDE